MVKIIKIQSEIPLTSAGPARYRGIAFDGGQLFATKQGAQEVIRLDDCLKPAESFPTCRRYTCLCYDPCLCCFWAADDRHPSVLYKLDECLREADLIRLKNPETGGPIGVITGLSYDCEEKCFLLSTSCELLWVSITADGADIACIKKAGRQITGVVSAGGSYYICCFVDGRQMIRYCSRSGEVIWECCVPKDMYVDAGVFACTQKSGGDCRLYALASKYYCYQYILECAPSEGTFRPSLCCQCRPKPPCPGPEPCENLLLSIASMQTALSGILNAEAEKLRRITESTDDPAILLKVNKAVNRTLIDATFLEQVLYHKMELSRDICGPEDLCCPPEHETDGPCCL